MSAPEITALPAPPPLDHATVRAIMVAIMFPMFLGALDSTIVATALPAIATSLNDFDNISWVVTAYLLAATVATPLYGKLSDIHGRRTMMLIAIGFVLAGSLVSANSRDLGTLVVGRVLQGLGGAGVIPLAQAIVAEITTPMERPRYQGYTSAMFMSSTLIGPVLGGVISDYLHWSVIFWLNLPLTFIAFAVVAIVLRKLPRHDRPHKLDILGAALMMSAGLALMLAMTWGGRRYPWLSPQVLGLFGVSALLWAGFGWRVVRAPEPFVPLSILSNKIVRNATAASFFGVGTIIGLTILIPLYLKIGLGLSATLAGAAVIALQGGATVTSIASTFLIVRMVHYMRVPLFAVAIAFVALTVLVIEPLALPLWMILILVTMIGIGVGPMFPISIITIQNVVAPRQLGIATGVMGFFRTLGGTFIVAAFGAIMLGGAEMQAGTVAADPNVFRWVFAAAIGCLLAAFAACWGIEELPFRGPGELIGETTPRL